MTRVKSIPKPERDLPVRDPPGKVRSISVIAIPSTPQGSQDSYRPRPTASGVGIGKGGRPSFADVTVSPAGAKNPADSSLSDPTANPDQSDVSLEESQDNVSVDLDKPDKSLGGDSDLNESTSRGSPVKPKGGKADLNRSVEESETRSSTPLNRGDDQHGLEQGIFSSQMQQHREAQTAASPSTHNLSQAQISAIENLSNMLLMSAQGRAGDSEGITPGDSFSQVVEVEMQSPLAARNKRNHSALSEDSSSGSPQPKARVNLDTLLKEAEEGDGEGPFLVVGRKGKVSRDSEISREDNGNVSKGDRTGVSTGENRGSVSNGDKTRNAPAFQDHITQGESRGQGQTQEGFIFVLLAAVRGVIPTQKHSPLGTEFHKHIGGFPQGFHTPRGLVFNIRKGQANKAKSFKSNIIDLKEPIFSDCKDFKHLDRQNNVNRSNTGSSYAFINLDLDITINKIKEMFNFAKNKIIGAQRIKVKGKDTRTVKLQFATTLPPLEISDTSSVPFLYSLEPGTLSYLRCSNCQKHGHHKNICRSRSPACPHCAGYHTHNECNNRRLRRCINCGSGTHGAAWWGCPAFREYKAKVDRQNSEIKTQWATRKQEWGARIDADVLIRNGVDCHPAPPTETCPRKCANQVCGSELETAMKGLLTQLSASGLLTRKINEAEVSSLVKAAMTSNGKDGSSEVSTEMETEDAQVAPGPTASDDTARKSTGIPEPEAITINESSAGTDDSQNVNSEPPAKTDDSLSTKGSHKRDMQKNSHNQRSRNRNKMAQTNRSAADSGKESLLPTRSFFLKQSTNTKDSKSKGKANTPKSGARAPKNKH